MAEQALEEPRLVLDSTHEHHELFTLLDEFIRDDPGRFLMALSQLGDIGITGAQPDKETLGPGEVGLVKHIFENRLDQDLEFDDTTENFLASDPEQVALIERMHSQRARSKGKYEKVQVEDNPGALRYRDIIRRRRLAVLALRTHEWQETVQAPQLSKVPPIPRQTGSPAEPPLNLVA